jgi:hypothetical protein
MDHGSIPERSERTPTEGRFLLNAVVAAVVGVVLGFVPLSPALGGAVGSYLNGGTRSTGLQLGAVAGLLASVPVFAGGALFALVAIAGGPGARAAAVFLVVMLAVLLFTALYVVGLSAAGGWAGIYLRERRDGRRPRHGKSPDGEHDIAHPEV